jgi:sedoheptulokinase
MRVLGIDIGSTSIKGAVLDVEKQRVGPGRGLPFPECERGKVSGRHETRVQAIAEVVDALLAPLMEEAPEADALFLTGQMHGMAVFDPAGGMTPLTPFISWQDERLLELRDEGPGSWLDQFGGRLTPTERAHLGNETRAGQGALTLACLNAIEALPEGAVALPIAEAVVAAWTSRCPGVIDRTFAASLGNYDLARERWLAEVMARWGLRRFRWPEVSCEPTVQCRCRRHGRELTVYAAVGDHQAALLGVGLSHEELSINVSTGAQIAARTDRFSPGAYQTRPFPGGGFVNTFSHLPAGQMLNMLVSLLTEMGPRQHEAELWEIIRREVEAVPETPLRIDLSFVECLTGSEGRQMAETFRAQALRLDSSMPWQRLALSGSLARRSAALQKELTKAFGLPCRCEESEEETLQGLLFWARRALSSKP